MTPSPLWLSTYKFLSNSVVEGGDWLVWYLARGSSGLTRGPGDGWGGQHPGGAVGHPAVADAHPAAGADALRVDAPVRVHILAHQGAHHLSHSLPAFVAVLDLSQHGLICKPVKPLWLY